MTLKIGETQFSNINPSEIPEKFKIGQLQSNTTAQNESAINFLANNGGANRLDNPNKEKTSADFLREILAQQPVNIDDENAAKMHLTMKIDKSPQMTTRDDYNLAFRRAVYNKAMDGLKLSDEEIKLADQALIDAGLYRTYYNLQGTLDDLKVNQQKSENQMPISVGKENIEYARRAGQAILQYQNYKAQQNNLAIESGKTYVNEAIGGFVQPIVNAPVNIVNGLSEPFRAGERGIFGTNYIPEIPKMTVAERSEYWNKDGRMYANKGGEIAATIALGGIFGGKAIATQTGRTLIGLESVYNIGAGIAGKDVTQTDERGNARQMEWTERGLRIAGGLFGARQTVKTEISTPNSLTNKAVDKLDDIFKNPPTFRPQAEPITPNGFRFKITENTFEKPFGSAADLSLEMRGRGGYESNEIFDRLGTKMPKVRQPLQVKPSLEPDPLNQPLGSPSKIPAKGNAENIRGLTRENQSAETLARNGYKVEQKPQMTYLDRISNPWRNTNKNPDFKIEGEIFDAYAPNKLTEVDDIRGHIETKVTDGQTRRIVLNLDDNPLDVNDLRKVISEKLILELEQILVVKNSQVEHFFPFK